MTAALVIVGIGFGALAGAAWAACSIRAELEGYVRSAALANGGSR
jgi:hypothetical protein